MEGGGEGDYIIINMYRYTVTTRMTSALRWAAMRGILINVQVSVGSDGQSHRTVSTNHTDFLKRKEGRSGIDPGEDGPSAYQPNSLPLDQTGSLVGRGLDNRYSSGTH